MFLVKCKVFHSALIIVDNMSSDDEKTEVQWEALGAMLAGLGVSNDTSKAVLPGTRP